MSELAKAEEVKESMLEAAFSLDEVVSACRGAYPLA